MSTVDTAAPSVQSASQRRVGPYSLVRLIGKSSVGMVWLAQMPNSAESVLLYLPRQACPSSQALNEWQQSAGRVARIKHPQLAPILSTGTDGLWPYLVIEHRGSSALLERVSNTGSWPATDVAVQWTIHCLEALSALHDAGVTHTDLGQHTVLIDASGQASLIPPVIGGAAQEALGIDRDIVMSGLLLHGLLMQRPALDQADLTLAASTINQDIVRLPWTTPKPVAEALRAIVNRATDHHAGRRFVSTRGLLRALNGWTESDGNHGAIAQLLNHLPHAGLLPAMPGLTSRVARLVSHETGIDAMVDVMLEDPALTFEMLRLANATGSHSGEEGIVISPRRAIQLLGLDGIRRAANGLKAWPGVLGEDRSQALRLRVERLCLVSRIAAALSPPGLRREEPTIAVLFQGLPWLLVLYHFPDEAQQIQELLSGGMSGQPAACAVLGTDEESMALAVVRQWGWRDAALDLVRPFNAERATSRIEHLDWLRCMASAADDALETYQRVGQEATPSMERNAKKGMSAVALKYHRLLGATTEDLQRAIAQAQERVRLSPKRVEGEQGKDKQA